VPEDASLRQSLLSEWGRLARSPSASIFLHPDLALAAGGEAPVVYAGYTRVASGAVELHTLAALAPKTRHFRLAPGLPLGLTLRGRRLVGDQLLGDDSAAAASAFAGELARWLRAGGAGRDFVLFEEVECDSALWQALRAEASRGGVVFFAPEPPQPHWRIQFPDPPADYWKQFPSKMRNNLRRAAKKLEHTLVCCSTPADVPRFLEGAHAVSRRSWQAKRLGLRVHNSPQEQRLLQFLASVGALRCYLLEQQGRPLAFELGIQWQGRFSFEETGYDTAYAGQSPGTVLLFRILEDLVERQTPRWCDFGFGDGLYKRDFGNHQTLTAPVFLMRRGGRPLLARALLRSRAALSRGGRAVLRRLRFLSALRRGYRK
jgi:CelD/BcsL family acetyltransferase involved in cellulose biosynthesis